MGTDPNAELYRVLLETADHPDTPVVVVAELTSALATVVAKRLDATNPIGLDLLYGSRDLAELSQKVVGFIHQNIESGWLPDDRWLTG